MNPLDPLLDALISGVRDRLSADELVVFPFGLEANAARKLMASGELPTRKLGRKFYARRSRVLALVPDVQEPTPQTLETDTPEDVLSRMATRTRRAR